MQITDPIADMLTRIRNAGSAKHETVDVPRFQDEEGYRRDPARGGLHPSFQLIDDGTQGVIRHHPEVPPRQGEAIQGLKRVSKPAFASTPAPTSCPASCAASASPSFRLPRAS